MRTVEIPGGTARIKDRGDLRGRDSKLIKASALAAQNVLAKIPEEARPKPGEDPKEAGDRMQKYLEEHPLDLTAEEGMLLLDMKEAVMVAYLVDWTLDLALPTMKTIGDLPDEIYQALDDATGGETINAAVSSVNFEVNPDKNSPTGPSGSSDSSLRAGPDLTEESLSTSQNGSDPSSGESSSVLQRTSTTVP